MIINTSEFSALPRLTSAVLTQSTEGVSSLSLGWAGLLPDWAQYMTPVTVMHRGNVLFHGKITALASGNSGGEMTSECTVSDFFWALDNQTLGEQLAQIQESLKNQVASTLSLGANSALVSWANLADSLHMSLPEWTCDNEGTPRADGEISLDTTLASYSFGAFTEKRRAISCLTALLEMQQANPDCFFLPDYVAGKVKVVSMTNAEKTEWDTQSVRLTEASGIAPCYEKTVTGVCGVVTYGTGMRSAIYPEDIPVTANGVKIFSLATETASQAAHQLKHILPRLKAWYEAANILQHNGTVTAVMQDVASSPIGWRINISGKGTSPEWANMNALVSSAEWDFLGGLVALTLGKNIEEPELHELNFATNDGGDEGGDDGGNEDVDDSDSGDFSTWSYDTTATGGSILVSQDTQGSSGGGTQTPPTPGDGSQGTSGTHGGGSGACCECPEYEFDEEWFTVTEKNGKTEVSINESKVQEVAENIVQNIEMQVNVTGLSEVTAYGTLTVTATGSGTVDRGEIKSTIQY